MMRGESVPYYGYWHRHEDAHGNQEYCLVMCRVVTEDVPKVEERSNAGEGDNYGTVQR